MTAANLEGEYRVPKYGYLKRSAQSSRHQRGQVIGHHRWRRLDRQMLGLRDAAENEPEVIAKFGGEQAIGVWAVANHETGIAEPGSDQVGGSPVGFASEDRLNL